MVDWSLTKVVKVSGEDDGRLVGDEGDGRLGGDDGGKGEWRR